MAVDILNKKALTRYSVLVIGTYNKPLTLLLVFLVLTWFTYLKKTFMYSGVMLFKILKATQFPEWSFSEKL